MSWITTVIRLAGVPKIEAVPLLRATNRKPRGSRPFSARVGVGKPLVRTVKLPRALTLKMARLADVIAGAWSTVSVNVWVAAGETPFEAVIVVRLRCQARAP